MTKFQSKQGGGSAMSIADVERDCGLSKDTLRVWERRYGFPSPLRDHHDERVYPADQISKLRVLRRLIDAGHRPSKIVSRSLEELTALIRPPAGQAAPSQRSETAEVLELLRAHKIDHLREAMAGHVLQSGLAEFAMHIAPDLAQAVGAAWSAGELEIYQEHLFTQQLTAVLRSTINAVLNSRPTRSPPRVLLATFPQEPHALGILMAEAVFMLQGCATLSLGPQVPVSQIAAGASACGADILALSCSGCMTSAQAHGSLTELRGLVDPKVGIWVGGSCTGLRGGAAVRVLRKLSDIGPAVDLWRENFG
jgi:DNA-binding transcriptional MerR regulator/methylmalonyl-CoA mutase cobalamin-binding subunit